jgi:uncharacterized membrane protein YkvI
VGSIVGVGFASGQEIWQYFSRFGLWGTPGIAAAGLGFFFAGWLILDQARRHRLKTFADLLHSAYPLFLARAGDGVVLGFLWVGLAISVAGGGTTLPLLLPISAPWATAFCMSMIVLLAVLGPRASAATTYLFLPAMLWTIILLQPALPAPGSLTVPPFRWRPVPLHWALAATAYLSYNLFTAAAVLLPLGEQLPNSRAARNAAALGALILAGLAWMEHRILLTQETWPAVPLVHAVERHVPWLAHGYAGLLWLALMSSGVNQATALTAHWGRRMYWLVPITWLVSQLGFAQLIAALYPVMGTVALIIWYPLCRLQSHPPSRQDCP